MKSMMIMAAVLLFLLWFETSFAGESANLNFTPPFRASVQEQRDQLQLFECDKRASDAKVPRDRRFDFIRRCLLETARSIQ
jgi:hypothetical protein